MNQNDPVELNRRRLLVAAMLGGGAAITACSPAEQPTEVSGDMWAGFDGRITERTLAEAEKLFGIAFTEPERRHLQPVSIHGFRESPMRHRRIH
jgi:hypothetical protein